MRRALLAPDYLTNYRYPFVRSFFYILRSFDYSVCILAPKSTIKNLKFFCPDPSLSASITDTSPIFAFNKYTIFSTSLLPSFFSQKPTFVLLWGEINRIDNWIILFYKLLFCRKLHVAIWTHGLYGRESSFILFLRILMVKLSTHCFLYDTYPIPTYLKHGLPRHKFSVIGNSYPDIESYFPLPRASCNQSLNLLFVGRMSKRKRLDLLISALESFDLPFPVHLTIVSPDVQVQSSCSISRHLIKYHPALYSFEDLKSFYLESHFTICPDNLGLFCITSLKAGRPIITHLNFPYHGPEATCLNPQNCIELSYPVTSSAIIIALTKAFNSILLSNSFDPDIISSSLPIHFASSQYASSIITDYLQSYHV
jgi:glycosyltransferase involved in cell wall biosynthesis